MADLREVKPKETFIGKLDHGSDLLEELNRFCCDHDIRLGRVEALGAVQQACLGFYDQATHAYQFSTIDKPLEITNLVGNVSIKDGQPFVHAHITLADEDDQAFGGHVMPGTIVFACEVIVESFDGPAFVRGLDRQTGLPLWEL